jgi:hypothetical protein
MTNDERITALAQDIYLARHGSLNEVDDTELPNFLDQTIGWINQIIPEIEKKADWNFVRTNDNTVGTIVTPSVISYALPDGIRKLVIAPGRDLTIRFGTSTIASFKLVSPNQSYNTNEPYDIRDRATVLKRKVIFSRPLKDIEVGGTIIADTIAKVPKLSHEDVTLLDILDDEYNDDIRQMFIYGALKNQVLPDIVQGGLTPSYSQKFDRYLQDCITENNASSDADDQDRESFSWVGGVGF